jgi:cyanophycinase
MERGRLGRLLGAVAQNPKNLGIGIDEQTAIVVERGNGFYVLGSGAVYVIDGSEVTYSNIAEEDLNKTLSIYNVRMHMLSQGDRFDLIARRPRKNFRRSNRSLNLREWSGYLCLCSSGATAYSLQQNLTLRSYRSAISSLGRL